MLSKNYVLLGFGNLSIILTIFGFSEDNEYNDPQMVHHFRVAEVRRNEISKMS